MIIKPGFLLIFLLGIESSMAQTAQLVKLEKLETLIHAKNDHIQVINFWATWCAPCVKEMPLFEKLNLERKDVKVVLVSMDMDLDPDAQKIEKFIARKGIHSSVIILNERNPNLWINKIDKNWSGALPATLVINGMNGKRMFVERELHEGELEKLIEEVK